MRKWLMISAGVAALTAFAPAPTFAQGFEVGVPGVGGVRVGEPHHRYYRDYGPRYRERDVYLGRRGGCRTVTVERDDGSVKRIRRCD
jgi:hypothetical protein